MPGEDWVDDEKSGKREVTSQGNEENTISRLLAGNRAKQVSFLIATNHPANPTVIGCQWVTVRA